MEQLLNDDRPPQIFQGEGAELQPLRDSLMSEKPEQSTAAAMDKIRVKEEESPLSGVEGLPVDASWKIEEGETMEGDFRDVSGHVFITTERLLFVSTNRPEHDVAVDAACILLHAMSSEPLSIYVQIQDLEAEEMNPMELTLVPVKDAEIVCQKLFDALSKLVMLHPIELDDTEDGDDGDMVYGPADSGEATEEEREAMLQRLDNLLVVPPEYEIQEGQFDDPNEDVRGGDGDEDSLL